MGDARGDGGRAHRPPEWRDWGAGQTIDQHRLYGSHVRWFAEAPTPETSLLRYARALACRAFAVASGPPAGPVHLNLPFREPLDPRVIPEDQDELDPLGARGRDERAYFEVSRPTRTLDAQSLQAARDCISRHPRGAVICGPMDAEGDFAFALSALARATGWPIIADALSSLRGGPHVKEAPLVATADLLLRDPRFAAEHTPSCVIHFGDAPTSKAIRNWLDEYPPEDFIRVDPDGSWHDPAHQNTQVITADPTEVCMSLAAALPYPPEGSAWLASFLDAEQRASTALEDCLESQEEILEPRAVRELAAALPEDALLYASNSMPVRDLDAFLPVSPRKLRIIANRGAAGIDGMVSSALGAAATRLGPVTLLVGDVALAHDLSGLFAARRLGESLRVIVFDNRGGGIFSFLPIAEYGEPADFEKYFLTPPDLDLEAIARAAGARYERITDYAQLRCCLEETRDAPALQLLHLEVDREHNVAAFRAAAKAVGNAWRPGEA